MNKILKPDAWGLGTSSTGELLVNGFSSVDLAQEFGTPLHVVNARRLQQTAETFRRAAETAYAGKVSVHFAFKCNPVPGVVQIIKKAELKAEVMSEFELELATRLGFSGNEIVVNGPFKPEPFLKKCLKYQVRFIVVDSLEELQTLQAVCASLKKEANILLRVNPDYVPSGMNSGSATGSRKGCAFGLDLEGNEVSQAFLLLKDMPEIRFRGFHFHIGTGIRKPADYANALKCLKPLLAESLAAQQPVRVIDVGGGFASFTTKEMSSREMLLYQTLNKLPAGIREEEKVSFQDFTSEISRAVSRYFTPQNLPEIIYEPGRSIASSNQFLLLTVHRVKERPGVGEWVITDGGLGTVTLPTFYEYHEVFLCNDVRRPFKKKVTLLGPGCFAGDVIYRNKPMPRLHPGEVLAIMDSGAYFTQMESVFSFPRPAIVAVLDGKPQLIRRRESFAELILRDNF